MDYWNEGLKIHKDDPKKAIELYKKALEIKDHPFLYTNIASCYNNLNDRENMVKYYKKAYPILKKGEFKYSSDPYNNCAWYLYEEKEYEKALEIAKLAIFIDPNKSSHRDTIGRILIALKKEEEALAHFSYIYKFDPNFDGSKDYIDANKDKIENYIKNYWKYNDKKEVLENIFEKYSAPKELIDYIVKKGKKHKHSQFYYWGDVAKDMIQIGFDQYGDEVIKIYNIQFKYQYSYYNLFNFWDSFYGENFDKLFKVLKLMDSTPLIIIQRMVNNSYKYMNNESFLKKAGDFILPKYESSVIKSLKEYSNYNTKKWASMLLLNDYDKYEKNIKDIFLNMKIDNYNTKFDTLILLKDQEFIKERYLYFIDEWLKNKKSNTGFKFDVDKIVVLYIETGKKDKDFDKILTKFSKKFSKWERGFYDVFLNQIRNFEDIFFKRVLDISRFLSPYSTIKGLVEFNVNTFIDNSAKYGISIEDLSDYLVHKMGDSYEDKWPKSYLKILLEKEDLDKLLEGAKNSDMAGQVATLDLFWEFDKDKTYNYIMELIKINKGKSLREKVAKVLANYQDKYEDFKELLNAKKQSIREFGVAILSTFDNPEIDEIFKKLYDTDRSKGVKGLINNYFEKNSRLKEDSIDKFDKKYFLDRSEKLKVKGDKISKLSWLDVSKLPNIYWKDSDEKLSPKMVHYMFNTFSLTKDVIPSFEGRVLSDLIDKKYIYSIIDIILENWSQDSKTKWILGFISAFGGDRYVTKLTDMINNFIAYGRGAMGAHVVKAMAMMGTSKALTVVDRIARKERHKQVKKAAKEAIEIAAKELNMNKEELLDKIVPDFGFSIDGVQKIDYGSREFVIKLKSDLTIEIINDKGKIVKNLPKPGKNDDEEKGMEGKKYFKELKKELKIQVALQKDRLEESLAFGRLWNIDPWLELFTKNPIMNIFATGLVWGVYKDNKFIDSFRYMDDQSFNSVDDEQFDIPKDAKIGLLHPLEMDSDLLDGWREQFEDYEIVPPFNQLDRSIYTPTEEILKSELISDFKGYMLTRIALKQKLYKMGWSNGDVEDAGCYYSYVKEFPEINIRVELEFLGDCMGGYYDYEEVPIYDLSFCTIDKRKGVKIGDVPKRFISEIYYQVKKVAESGSGFNEDWEKVSW